MAERTKSVCTPRHIIDQITAAISPVAPVHLDPATTRRNWTEIARRVAESTDPNLNIEGNVQ